MRVRRLPHNDERKREMPLNLEPRSSEDFIPYIKYNGKAGRWYIRNDAGMEDEVRDMTAIFDLANIKTGWIMFSENGPPVSQWDNGAMAAQPGPNYKRGFSVKVFSPQKLGGMREYQSNANVSIIAIRNLYEAYEAAPEAKQGLVPVVQCTDVAPIKGFKGVNYQPTLKIVKWVPRPDGLTIASKSPVAKTETKVPPPMSHTATEPQPATSDQEEF